MQKALEVQEIQAMQLLIEHATDKREDRSPADRRKEDLLGNFKYLQRIRYGCMDNICQVLACKYYYRPRSVYAIIQGALGEIDALEEVPLGVNELMIIAQKLKMPNWMDGMTRRHNELREMFQRWQSLGSLTFLCRLLGYKFYYKPDSVRYILKS